MPGPLLIADVPWLLYRSFFALPSSITDHAWVKLSHAFVEKAKRLRLKLRESKKAFRFLTLWISRAPASSIGTPQAPGHVSVNELELFPAG